MTSEFNKWWDEDDLTTQGNNFVDGTPAYWAWEGWCAGVKAEREACAKVAQLAQEPNCYGYAARLATAIWEQHYKNTAPQWQVFDDLMGVLTQIDNMAAGLVSPPQPEERNFCQRCGKRTADLTTIHTCTPPRGQA